MGETTTININPVSLMIVGAQKCGTTSLFRFLSQHPQILTHPQAEMTYFFNAYEYDGEKAAAWKRYFGALENDAEAVIAKHVMIMYSEEAIARLFQHNPRVHTVVMLRNPIDRAYSAYWYARRLGRETLTSFEAALAAEPERLAEDRLFWRNTAYVTHGCYAQYLRTLFEYFGRDQVHVYTTKDLRERPLKICRELFAAAGVDSAFEPEVAGRHNASAMARSEKVARVLNLLFDSRSRTKLMLRRLVPDSISYRIRNRLLKLNEREFAPPPMAPETREALRRHFLEPNGELSDLLGRDLSEWNR